MFKATATALLIACTSAVHLRTDGGDETPAPGFTQEQACGFLAGEVAAVYGMADAEGKAEIDELKALRDAGEHEKVGEAYAKFQDELLRPLVQKAYAEHKADPEVEPPTLAELEHKAYHSMLVKGAYMACHGLFDGYDCGNWMKDMKELNEGADPKAFAKVKKVYYATKGDLPSTT